MSSIFFFEKAALDGICKPNSLGASLNQDSKKKFWINVPVIRVHWRHPAARSEHASRVVRSDTVIDLFTNASGNKLILQILWTLVTAILSGSVAAGIMNALFQRRTEYIRNEFQKAMAAFQSERIWEERSTAELLGPMWMQFERTKRAIARWKHKNLFLEAKVVREGNLTIRDLILTKPQLIPPLLRKDAGDLIEHYDRWLEEYERVRGGKDPNLDTEFVFAGAGGPDSFPFPSHAEVNFKREFERIWEKLYGEVIKAGGYLRPK
jgi:hypothetical protein